MKYFSTVFALIVITFLFYKIELKENTIEQLQKELNIQKSLYEDTIQYQKYDIQIQQHHHKQILDSLPLGSPLDTLTVTSNFGSRKNKATQKWEYHPGIDFLADKWV